MILAGDIGGTNTRLAIFESREDRLKPVVAEIFPSRQYNSLDDIVKKFLLHHGLPITRACFGIAGPTKQGRSTTSNLAWVVDAGRLSQALHLKTVDLINDLEANAFGIAALTAEDFLVLKEGVPDSAGNAAIISAGTGLGEGGLYWDGRQHHPFASEGGHADFAPRNELEIELLRYLLTLYPRVSYERVLSGPGLYNIYRFFRFLRSGQEPDWLGEQLRQRDPAAVISQAALGGKCPVCVESLDLFVSIYGAEAGNLALKVMARGGVFVGGGIAPKIVQKLKGPKFLEAFVEKGRMKSLLDDIPVRVILNDKTALIGAARYAMLRG